MAKLVCSKHGDTAKFFWCHRCSLSICVHCLAIDHRADAGHEIQDLAEATAQKRTQVTADLSTMENKLNDVRNQAASLTNNEYRTLNTAVTTLRNKFVAAQSKGAQIDQDCVQIQKTTREFATFDVPNLPAEELVIIGSKIKDLQTDVKKLEGLLEEGVAEATSLQSSSVVVSLLGKESGGDVTNLRCLICGRVCQKVEMKPDSKDNDCKVRHYQHNCAKCSLTLMQFPVL